MIIFVILFFQMIGPWYGIKQSQFDLTIGDLSSKPRRGDRWTVRDRLFTDEPTGDIDGLKDKQSKDGNC